MERANPIEHAPPNGHSSVSIVAPALHRFHRVFEFFVTLFAERRDSREDDATRLAWLKLEHSAAERVTFEFAA